MKNDRENKIMDAERSVGSFPVQVVIIGTAALLLGFVLGFIGRGAFGPEANAARKTETASVYAVQTKAVQNQEIMKQVIAETRHFKGEIDAPISIIVFSDFK